LGGKVIESQVETVDIIPTLLQILGLSFPHRIHGKSLIPLIMGKIPGQERLAYSESYYPRYRYGWSELKSLRNSQYKYILAPKPEHYDIINDPKEYNNIYKQNITLGEKFNEKLKNLQEEMSAKGIEEKGPKKLMKNLEKNL
jgi:arylsulfatase A-like enzyme